MDFKTLLQEQLRKAKPNFHDDLRTEVGEKLAQRRKELGLSQKELAEKADIPQSRISLIEKGKCNVTLETLKVLFDALGYTIHITEEKKQ